MFTTHRVCVWLTITRLRARTRELEQQQPGVEGQLRRLLEMPGKRSRVHHSQFHPLATKRPSLASQII